MEQPEKVKLLVAVATLVRKIQFLFEATFESLNSTSNKKALRDQLTIDLEDKGLILGNTKASLELQIHSNVFQTVQTFRIFPNMGKNRNVAAVANATAWRCWAKH